MSQKVSEEEVDYAYSVIDAFKQAYIDATTNTEKVNTVFKETLEKLGDLFEATMILAEEQHRVVIYDLAKAYLVMVKKWAQK